MHMDDNCGGEVTHPLTGVNEVHGEEASDERWRLRPSVPSISSTIPDPPKDPATPISPSVHGQRHNPQSSSVATSPLTTP